MRALVLSGGGANGAWQEGVLRYLIEDDPLLKLLKSGRLTDVSGTPKGSVAFLLKHLEASSKQLQPISHVSSLLDCLLDDVGPDIVKDLRKPYDIICGVSVGALNGSVLAERQDTQYEIYASYRKLSKIWDRVRPKLIRKSWFLFGKIAAMWKNALYNSKPIWKLIRSNLTAEKIASSGVQLRVGAVNYNTGEYKAFTQDDLALVDGVIASSAYPLFFLPIEIGGQLWTDGGVRNIIPLNDAIAAGATEIDVVICQPIDPMPWDGKNRTLSLFGRFMDLMTGELVINDLRYCDRVTSDVHAGHGEPGEVAIKLRVFAPEKSVGDGLDFAPEKVAQLRAQGYEDAKKVISDSVR